MATTNDPEDDRGDEGEDGLDEVQPVRVQVDCELLVVVEQLLRVRHGAHSTGGADSTSVASERTDTPCRTVALVDGASAARRPRRRAAGGRHDAVDARRRHRRRRLGQDPGARPADRLPRRHRHRRRPPHAGADVHPPGRRRAAPPAPRRRAARVDRGGHVPLRRPRRDAPAVGRRGPAGAEHHQRPASPDRRRRRAVPGRHDRRRTLVVRRPRHRARRLRRRGASRRTAAAAFRRRPSPRSSPTTRRSSAGAASSTSTTCSSCSPASSTADRGVRRRRALALPSRPRRRGPGPQPGAVPDCSASSSPGATTSSSSATRPRRSTGSTAPTRRCSSTSTVTCPASRSSASRRTAGARRRSSPPDCTCCAPRASRGDAVSARDDGPAVEVRGAADEHAEADARRPLRRRPTACACCAPARSPCSPAPTSSSPCCASALDGGGVAVRQQAIPAGSPLAAAVGDGDRTAVGSAAAGVGARRARDRRRRPIGATMPPREQADRRVAAAALDFLREQPYGDGSGFRSWIATTRRVRRAGQRRRRRTAHVPRRQGPRVAHRRRDGRRDRAGPPPIGDDARRQGGGSTAAPRGDDEGERPAARHVRRATARLRPQAEPVHRRAAHRGGRRSSPHRRTSTARPTSSPCAPTRCTSWRRTAARAAALLPAQICSDADLSAIAAAPPSSPDELSTLASFGPVTAAQVFEPISAALDAADAVSADSHAAASLGQHVRPRAAGWSAAPRRAPAARIGVGAEVDDAPEPRVAVEAQHVGGDGRPTAGDRRRAPGAGGGSAARRGTARGDWPGRRAAPRR